MGNLSIQQLTATIMAHQQSLCDAENRIATLREELSHRWLPQDSEPRVCIDNELRELKAAVAHFRSEIPLLQDDIRKLQAAEDRTLEAEWRRL
jgi:prefoldin subunit 5